MIASFLLKEIRGRESTRRGYHLKLPSRVIGDLEGVEKACPYGLSSFVLARHNINPVIKEGVTVTIPTSSGGKVSCEVTYIRRVKVADFRNLRRHSRFFYDFDPVRMQENEVIVLLHLRKAGPDENIVGARL